MDRQAIARAQRRVLALEALEFERARAAALRERLETMIAELEGPAIDEAIFAGMTPEDVAVVRPTVQALELEPVLSEEEWLADEPGPAEPEPDSDAALEEQELEIARLQEEIASSLGHQRAFERYLEALGA
jgi:hypothetical protein